MNVLNNPRFEELKTTGRLPSPQGVARQILQLAQKEDVTAGEIVRLVKTDPALAARVVKAANQGAALGRRSVASVPDAIVVLGLRAVRQLALGFSVLSSYRDGACSNFDYARFWSKSLGTAVSFAALSSRVKNVPIEEAFVCGLLSRIGALALATIYPEEYSQVLQQHTDDSAVPLTQLEVSAFTMDHNELTASLFAEWGMPRTLISAARHHEVPAELDAAADARAHITARALHLATRLGDLCLAEKSERADLYPELRDMASGLGIDHEATLRLLGEIAEEWAEWGHILDLDSTRVPLIAQVMQPSMVEDTTSNTPAAPSSRKLRVLLADDDPAVLIQLRNILVAQGHSVCSLADGRAALDTALEMHADVIITDWMMPGMDGRTLCKALRETAIGRGVYIIVLTATDDVERQVDVLDAGADDYLRKPVSPRVLLARLRAGQRTLGMYDDLKRDRNEMQRYAADLAVANRRYQEAALTDSLTGFPNRRYAMDRLQQEWSAARRSGRSFACLMVDIDHFKRVNDTHGHDIGDKVLQYTADVLRDSARVDDTVCRLGGEEFLVVCPDTTSRGAQACAERLRSAVEAAVFRCGPISVRLTVSIGIAALHRTTHSLDALIKSADEALYRAKQDGRNCIRCANDRSELPALGT